jgi:hypothetical protein
MLRGKAMDEETRTVRFRGLARLASYVFAFVFVVELKSVFDVAFVFAYAFVFACASASFF